MNFLNCAARNFQTNFEPWWLITGLVKDMVKHYEKHFYPVNFLCKYCNKYTSELNTEILFYEYSRSKKLLAHHYESEWYISKVHFHSSSRTKVIRTIAISNVDTRNINSFSTWSAFNGRMLFTKYHFVNDTKHKGKELVFEPLKIFDILSILRNNSLSKF